MTYNPVVNNELCLSLLNLDYTMVYPPDSITALHVDKMPWATPIDDRWEFTQGTLKRGPVFLSLSRFTPNLMNEDIEKVFNECFNPNECCVDELVFDPSSRDYQFMFQWFYNPMVPIKPGWDCISEELYWVLDIWIHHFGIENKIKRLPCIV